MKAFLTTIALLAATAFVAPVSNAAEKPGALETYNFPIGATLKLGAAVQPVATPEFQQALQTLSAKIQALPEDKRTAIASKLDLTELPGYSADLWASKADYNAYKAAFKQTKIQPTQEVLVSLQPLGNDMWRLNSATVDRNQKAAPLTISALRYNARSNTWISNNGELRPNDYSVTESMFGAQTGTEWRLEKSDEFSSVEEVVRFSKTKDGQYVYIVYDFIEKSAISSAVIARGGYVLRFETGKK